MELIEAVDADHVAAEGQVARLVQHVLGAEAPYGVRMGAHEGALLGKRSEAIVEAIAPRAVFDRIAPHQDNSHVSQLRRNVSSEVIVQDHGTGTEACRSERFDQGANISCVGSGNLNIIKLSANLGVRSWSW